MTKFLDSGACADYDVGLPEKHDRELIKLMAFLKKLKWLPESGYGSVKIYVQDGEYLRHEIVASYLEAGK